MLEKESLQQKKSITGPRTIKSFVRREGRITTSQQYALNNLWSKYVLSSEQNANINMDKTTVLEIGFGNGESLAIQAEQTPEADFIGIEVYRAGVGRMLSLIEKAELTNMQIYAHDAVEVIQKNIPQQSIDRIQLFFPDPWPKKRHHKRRLVQHAFLDMIKPLLKTNGLFHVATDWLGYAEHVEEVLAERDDFQKVERPELVNARPKTKFERRGERLGHGVYDLVYQVV